MIARRIHGLIRDGSVYDKETEMLRQIRYSDIVILARSITDGRRPVLPCSGKKAFRLTR